MDSPRDRCKKGLFGKTWDRCKSFSGSIGRKGSLGSIHHALKMKSKSWPRSSTTMDQIHEENPRKKHKKVAPEGCFSIYVGPQKERFMIKTEYVNHPLFKMLLEEAESEYGYSSEGPLLLPCEVDHFIKVLVEMDYRDEEIICKYYKGCNFVSRSQSYHLIHPPRFLALNSDYY